MALSLVKLPSSCTNSRRALASGRYLAADFGGLSTGASDGRARACTRRLCSLTRRCSLNHLLTSTSLYIKDYILQQALAPVRDGWWADAFNPSNRQERKSDSE